MGTEIKIRLLKLGKKQVDLIPCLKKRGIEHIHTPTISRVINYNLTTPQENKIRQYVLEILDEWEAEAQKKGE